MLAALPPLASNVISAASTCSSYSSPILVRVLCSLVYWFYSAKIEEGCMRELEREGEEEDEADFNEGHEKPLALLRYNQEGDLLLSYAKDHNPIVWFADNGERLSTY